MGIIFPDTSEFGVGTNWQNEVIVNAPIIRHSLTASGGSDKTSYYVSTGYTGQDGVVAGGDKSFFNRVNFTTNLDTDLTDKTKLIINTNYTDIKSKGLPVNGKTNLAHTLNGSSLALPRVLASIIENFQTDKGILIPKVLHKYTGFSIIN